MSAGARARTHCGRARCRLNKLPAQLPALDWDRYERAIPDTRLLDWFKQEYACDDIERPSDDPTTRNARLAQLVRRAARA